MPTLSETSLAQRTRGAHRALQAGADGWEILALVVWPDADEDFYRRVIARVQPARCRAILNLGPRWTTIIEARCSRRATSLGLCTMHLRRVRAGKPQLLAVA